MGGILVQSVGSISEQKRWMQIILSLKVRVEITLVTTYNYYVIIVIVQKIIKQMIRKKICLDDIKKYKNKMLKI